MPADIAVYVGENGETASFYEKGRIAVYRKKKAQWSVLREKDFILDQNLGLKELRCKMREALFFINGCRIFVGLSITGLLFFELEKSNFSIWEFAGRPAEFLDHILAREEEAAIQKTDQPGLKSAPVEISGGRYRVSLKEIQENNMGLTSKQVLLPFLRKGDFFVLEVICSHFPPWLEAEIMSGNLACQTEKSGQNEIKIILTKKTCHDIY